MVRREDAEGYPTLPPRARRHREGGAEGLLPPDTPSLLRDVRSCISHTLRTDGPLLPAGLQW